MAKNEEKLSTTVEQKEKSEKVKKIPFIIIGIGGLLILIGIILMFVNKPSNSKNKSNTTNNNELVCIKTFTEEGKNIKEEAKYIFQDNVLSTVELNITTYFDNADDYNNLLNQYNSMFNDNIDGVTSNYSTVENEEISLNLTIDYGQYNNGLNNIEYLNRDIITKISKENSREEIATEIKSQSGLCE